MRRPILSAALFIVFGGGATLIAESVRADPGSTATNPQPSVTPPAAGPSLEETVGFINTKLAIGTFELATHEHGPAPVVTRVRFDSCNQLTFVLRYPEQTEWGYNGGRFETPLNYQCSGTVPTAPSLYSAVNRDKLYDAFTIKLAAPAEVETECANYESGGSSWSLQHKLDHVTDTLTLRNGDDADTTERLFKAFSHLRTLCGAKDEPF